MNPLYFIALAGILALFLWRKYVSYTKKRNQYIQYLQTQVATLSQQQQENSNTTEENNDDDDVNSIVLPNISATVVTLNEPAVPEKAPEDTTKIVEVEDHVMETRRYETPDDPEKVPLCDMLDTKLACHETEEVGKCCVEPILEQNFADVPENLFDRGGVSVGENDPDCDVVAHNTSDDTYELPKDDSDDCDSDSAIEEDEIDLTPTKQMHCTRILTTGKRKGSACGRKAHQDGLCKLHI